MCHTVIDTHKIVSMMRVCKCDMCLPKKKRKECKSDMPIILS